MRQWTMHDADIKFIQFCRKSIMNNEIEFPNNHYAHSDIECLQELDKLIKNIKESK
jgi:hypothetical protein